MITDLLDNAQKNFDSKFAKWQRTILAYPVLFDELAKLGIETDLDPSDGSIRLRATGDKQLLQAVWRHLRIAGFRPSSRPKDEPTSYFSCWFDPPRDASELYAPFWFTFSSTVCKQVAVGKRTVTTEETIYETVCE